MSARGCGVSRRPARIAPRAMLFGGTTALFLAAVVPATAQQAVDPQAKAVYDRWCAGCHGLEGLGDGPAAAYMLPRPRDFTRGIYQIKTTPIGELASDADILRIIDEGMPGTAMPGWRNTLTSQQRSALVQHLKSFSRFFEGASPAEAIRPGRAPAVSDATLEEGRAAYDRLECWRCHGEQGRGDGPSAFEQTDDWGFPIRPANLSKNWTFSGGGRAEDIYIRLLTGIEGTPMPSQADAVLSGVVTEEQLWHLANYVRSLSPEAPPRVREVVRATRTEDPLPIEPQDEAWSETDEFYFPLAGQIVAPPRWFAPSVEGIWVSAMHDGEELALRLRWHDPSLSPDPRWLQWQEGLLRTMEAIDGGPTDPRDLPDAVAVQFPRTIPVGMDRPYFLMGDAQNPVYLWHWESGGDGAVEAAARGIGRMDPLPADRQRVTTRASWEDGEWVVVMRRALDVDDTETLTFESGRAIPIAFFVWDGDNSEADTRAAISTWYYLYLDEPGSNSIYIVPIGVTLLMFVLGLGVVSRAQRSGRAPEGTQASTSGREA